MGSSGPPKTYLDIDDLEVYRKLCQLHLEVCDLSRRWPAYETYEIGSQIRRASNSAPAQLAEKNDDRHLRNKIEGVNRSRGEAAETVHHPYVARLKGHVSEDLYQACRSRYKECIRMLNGLEKSLERHLPERERRWLVCDGNTDYATDPEALHTGWPGSDCISADPASDPFPA